MARRAVLWPRQVMAAAIETASIEEQQLPNERKTVTWKPRKEWLLKNILSACDNESEESEFSDVSYNENSDSVYAHPDLEELDDEVSSMPKAITSPELQTVAVYRVEDWDKELEESECNPYDADDFHCGSFEENNLLASYSWQEDSFYYPGCHHAACLAFTAPVRMTVTGQFDDADE